MSPNELEVELPRVCSFTCDGQVLFFEESDEAWTHNFAEIGQAFPLRIQRVPPCQVLTDAFACPITGQLMAEPYVGPDGPYKRAAIEEWLQHQPTAPMTRQRLSLRPLCPSKALADVEKLVLNGRRDLDF